MRIFSQSHPFTLSRLFCCPVGALLCTPSGSKVLHGGMQICTRSNISSFFFAIVAWKLGILRAWYRDDASPIDPIDIYSKLGGNSFLIIPFTNPTGR